ncbi:T9SS type B sorting domain-containing protein [Flavobacterium tegetincola]|uniref:T9SS type B sorting domain-containing protein n=1 Tax=Flavobacterium tegetincola TaxID=150172 RepID=UPI000687BEF5|nr:T9SS type B sorting domain-containing protein [Flavobacterium tegetincola]
MYYLRSILFLLFCSLSSLSYGQLGNFNFNATAVDETCTNNGRIDMSVSNTTSGAVVSYKLYLAPDYDNHIGETMASSFLALNAGSYRVAAIQTLGGQSSSKEIDVEINDLVENLDFELTSSAANPCDMTSTLKVVVMSGNPTSYEILSGPITRPLQTSNEFTNLVSGDYVVRVFDACNDALSKAYTFVVGNNTLSIAAPSLPDVFLSCNSAIIKNTISSNTAAPISFPLSITYTVTPPGGGVAQTISQNIGSGPTDAIELSQSINLFGSQTFSVQIKVVDNCGSEFTSTFQIDPRPKVTIQRLNAECGALYFNVAVSNYLPPFTLNFTSPSSFNPVAFNANYPGPYTTNLVTFGSETNTIPFDNYSLTVTDGCGNSRQINFEIKEKIIVPAVTAVNNGCSSVFGNVKVQIPDNRMIVAMSMTAAPSTYPTVLPQNMMSFVNAAGVFNHPNLPVGDYSFTITDSCGDSYTIEVTVPEFVLGALEATTRPDCNPTSGAVKLSVSHAALVSVIVTAAPPSFAFPIPYDASMNIMANGVLYMSGLPAGMYSFDAVDSCGFSSQTTAEIAGYTRNNDGFSINRKCGSFDIILDDTDASITGKTFWLQKFDPVTNLWGHPYTAIPFVEGTLPTATTAKQLFNAATLLNVFLLGEFRIIKVFDSYENGNPNARCSDLYVEFTVAPDLLLLGAYNLSCNNGVGPDNVVIDVEGVAPFNFKMTTPYVLDNGENNTFLDLADGTYNFQVTDNCGNIKNIPVVIGNLLPLARAIQPQNMLVCRTDGVQFGVFPLINQNPEILGTQKANTYKLTYHLTQQDADNGVNPLPDGYANVSNPQTIYARVQHKTIPLCYATTSFIIFAGLTPNLVPVAPDFLCEGFTKVLTADAGYTNYEWSTGETTQSITISEPGTYTVTVSTIYAALTCDASKDFVITGSNKATIVTVDTSDWSYNNNSVYIVADGLGTYLYSLDNVNFQSESVFTNLTSGGYTVYVKDENGCGTTKANFYLLDYPKFFTPNGDGYNDTWHVNFSSFEMNLMVDIFDRYGKLVKRLKGGEAGWDGTFNGNTLPATDYWFVVTREDGTVHKQHFSLKR